MTSTRVRRVGTGLVGVVLMVGALSACSADRAGTNLSVTITVGDCEPIEGATTVNWSGTSTASVRVVYRNAAGDTAPSDWMNATAAAASGSISVRTPAAALTGFWTVGTVTLATKSNGRGTLLDRAFEDCGIATIQTMPPVTDAPVIAPTTTVK